MRVTNGMLIDRLLANIHANQAELRRWQEQGASGRAINRPADDPVGTVQVLRAWSTLDRVERYQRSVEDARNWLEVSEAALAKAGEVLQRARELAVSGASGTLPAASYTALAQEVGQLLEELVNTANTTYDGRFVFGGQRTLTAPFSLSSGPPPSVTYLGDSGLIQRPVADLKTIPVNVPGAAVFTAAFGGLIALQADLAAADPAAVNGDLAALDAAIDTLLNFRAQLGARINRVAVVAARLAEESFGLHSVISRIEGADIPRVALELASGQTRLEMTLAAGARIIQPALINFLV